MEGGNQEEIEESSGQDSPENLDTPSEDAGGEDSSPDSSEPAQLDSTPLDPSEEQSEPSPDRPLPPDQPEILPSPLEEPISSPESLKESVPQSETPKDDVALTEASQQPEVEDTSAEGQGSSEPLAEQSPDKLNGIVSEEENPKEPEPSQALPVTVNGVGASGDRNEPFHPWFKSAVTDAKKDGENIIFTLETTRLDESGKQFKVERIYDDFEWLHHCLTTDVDIGGIVIPPLPMRPVASAAEAAAKSRRELGSSSKTLKGDEFEKDMRKLEKYTSSLIKHSVFGREIAVAKFLTESDPPIRAKLRKNILNNLSKAVEGVIKGGHQDVDESFQKHRLNAANMLPLARDMNLNFQAKVHHSERLSGALNHFSTALCLVSSANSNRYTAQMNEMQLTFARSMEHLSHASTVFSVNDDRTLGFTLDLYSKYADSVKQMLGRRTVKLYEFDNAVKSFEKAKPLKKQAAEDLKNQREKEFSDISETAKQELGQYKKQRTIDFQQALVLYAEAKIKTARDVYALLAKDLSSIKTMEMDGS